MSSRPLQVHNAQDFAQSGLQKHTEIDLPVSVEDKISHIAPASLATTFYA